MRHVCFLTFLISLSCSHVNAPEAIDEQSAAMTAPMTSDEFNAYWYSGKAEITTYDLQQARYGEVHPGTSILVFVTEDFNTEKQVKREMTTGDEYTSVLKLNKIDRFVTGIYDYSLMLSVFSPIERAKMPHALKTTMSAQDWCGQSYMQVNRTTDGYDAQIRSYFEAEGDEELKLADAYLEDEIWTLARLDPISLPQGRFEMMPSSAHLRLRHRPAELAQVSAQLVLESMSNGLERYVYKVDLGEDRKWELYISTEFPYNIEGWRMEVPERGGTLVTTAEASKRLRSAYWGQNDTGSRVLRDKLGIPSSY